MTYLQTEYFLHVAKTKSITRTSADLYISPPAISKQISLLEEELGFALFIRGPRGMELTPAGEIMYNHFYAQKTAFDYALQHARSIETMDNKEFHLGVLAKWAIYDQLHMLDDLVKGLPGQPQLKFHSCFNPGGSSVLERGELDAVLCIANDVLVYSQQHDLEFREIAKLPKVFLYSKANKLASKPNPEPSDFKHTPLLVISSKSAVVAHQNNMNLCHSLGFQPSIIYKGSLDDALVGVSMNEGFFICDSWLDPILMPDFKHIIIPDYHSVVIAWWKHNKNPYLQDIINFCTDQIKWPYTVINKKQIT